MSREPLALLDSGLGNQLVGFAISFAVIAGFCRTNHRACWSSVPFSACW